jgi:hypothetical protein
MRDPSPAELLALAKVVQAEVEKACPDQPPLVMRAVTLLVGEAYLQAAALEKVVNDIYRRPPTK